MRGLWTLTWLEVKIFLREPLGAFGTIAVPVLVFLIAGRVMGRNPSAPAAALGFVRVGLPVLVSILMIISAVLSLVTRAASSSASGPRRSGHRRFCPPTSSSSCC